MHKPCNMLSRIKQLARTLTQTLAKNQTTMRPECSKVRIHLQLQSLRILQRTNSSMLGPISNSTVSSSRTHSVHPTPGASNNPPPLATKSRRSKTPSVMSNSISKTSSTLIRTKTLTAHIASSRTSMGPITNRPTKTSTELTVKASKTSTVQQTPSTSSLTTATITKETTTKATSSKITSMPDSTSRIRLRTTSSSITRALLCLAKTLSEMSRAQVPRSSRNS